MPLYDFEKVPCPYCEATGEIIRRKEKQELVLGHPLRVECPRCGSHQTTAGDVAFPSSVLCQVCGLELLPERYWEDQSGWEKYRKGEKKLEDVLWKGNDNCVYNYIDEKFILREGRVELK